MKNRILLKLLEKVVPSLLDLIIKIIEELIKHDLDRDGKVGR